MTTTTTVVTAKHFTTPAEVAISLGLFLLAFIPRAYDLQRFVTADEAKWVYRSAQFLAAFLNGDLSATSVNLTPAVTTTWLGSLGLAAYYRLNQVVINLPLTDWLLSLPQFRVEMPVLVATRWPMVIFTSLGVVIIYWLARRLFNRTLAVLAAAFIALDPHPVGLSRILGHDAPAAIFMIISVLLMLLTVKRTKEHGFASSALPTIFSGIAAGLAFLSKAPALFLIPFTGLVFLGQVWPDRISLSFWLKQLILWLSIAYLTFVIVWPAAWVDPAGRPWAVIENAFLSATDQEEADSENYWLVPNLGPFYYLIHGGFKLSPLVMMGLLLALFLSLKKQNITPGPITNYKLPLLWLLAFAVLFTLFMTLGDKRSPRYILPIFPALAIIAAFGWLKLYRVASSKWQNHPSFITHHSSLIAILLILVALLLLFPYAPYYFTYFNPLLGGSYTAPNLVKLGWGEGLDQAGRFLQREHSGSRVGTAYTSTVAPFFQGDLSGPTGDRLDYVVLYRKQIQSGEPAPAFIQYYQQNRAIFSVNLNGISYADIYPGPAIQPAPASESGSATVPAGFRPLTPYGRIGETLEVDVLWQVNDTLPTAPAILTLVHNESPIEASGNLTRFSDDLVVSRHSLHLPDDLERGKYALLIDDHPLGEIELRRFQAPANMGPVTDTIFNNQIAVTGYQFNPTEDYIGVNLAWQALSSHLPDYTVFVQLLDAETNQRVAGVDTQPVSGEWPTSRWVKDEVVIDRHLIAIPYNMPPGYYKIIVGLYQPETGQRLILSDGNDHWILPWVFIRKE